MARDSGIGPTSAPCPACDGPGRPWAAKGVAYVICSCPNCGVLFARRKDGSGSHPAQTYSSYHSQSSFVAPDIAEASLGRLVASAARYRQTGRWLDLGFGEGALLSVAEKHGWKCYGTEVSPHALDFGKSRGWTVAADPAQDSRFSQELFDVVTMIELLEHLGDPRPFVREAVRRLRPGGFFYMTTPNAQSLNRWILGAEWSVVCPPEHLTLWTALAIRRLLASTSLRHVRIRAEGLNPAELISRLRPGSGPSPVHRQSAGVALSQALSRSRPRRALKQVANRVLTLLGVGDTLKVSGENGMASHP